MAAVSSPPVSTSCVMCIDMCIYMYVCIHLSMMSMDDIIISPDITSDMRKLVSCSDDVGW